jgi:high-affinity nickel-transport protein
VIVGLFIVTWAGALLIWRYGHVEEKWNARLQTSSGTTVFSPSELQD